MLQLFRKIYNFMFVPTDQSLLDQSLNIVATNISILSITFGSFIVHLILAITFPDYFTSVLFIYANVFHVRMTYYYIKTKKNGIYCFKEFDFWVVASCYIVAFNKYTYFMAILGPLLVNQWSTATQKIARSIICSLITMTAMAFFILPWHLNQTLAIEDIDELRNQLYINNNLLTYSYIMLTVISCAILTVRTVKIKDDEHLIRKEEVEKRIQAQDYLITSFSHELNNPIHTIMNNLTDLSTINNQEQKKLVLSALSSAQFLSCFLNNILDMSKVDKKSLDINPIPVKISQFFSDIWRSCETLIYSQNIDASLKLQSSITMSQIYMLDPHRIRQIIYNIINNSIKYTKQGKISLSASIHSLIDFQILQPTYPYLQSQSSNSSISNLDYDEGCTSTKYLRLEISDTGCGISKEKLQRLFNKQDQGNQKYDKQILKLGIGLWLTKSILDELDGQIHIFSEVGIGTTVIVLIPIVSISNELKASQEKQFFEAANRRSSLQHLDSISLNQLGNTKVAMIVEDVPFNVNIVKSYLHKLKITVIDIAENGQIAVNKYKQLIEGGIYIDMICMDIEMPIMNGKTAARLIREFENYKNLNEEQKSKIFFVSGNSTKSEIDECLDKEGQIRGDIFLKKPLQFNEFESTIMSMISKR